MSYHIKPLKSARDQLYKTPAQRKYILPSAGTCLITGSTGSGKTTILANLLSQPNMLKGYYDTIYVFCLTPCDTLTDNVKGIKKENVYNDDDPEILEEIYSEQKKDVLEKGFKKAKHICFILDDIISSKAFMGSKIIGDIFFGGTHNKTSMFLLSQNYMSVPRRWRMNAHAHIICHGVKQSEIQRFADENGSCYLSKDDFIKMVNYALAKPYSFMFYNCCNPNKKEAYRCGFNEILKIK